MIVNGMRLKVVVHPAEDGGYWAEVPALPGCASQGQTMDELLGNVREAIEAIEAWLSVDISQPSEQGAEVIVSFLGSSFQRSSIALVRTSFALGREI